MKRFNLIMGFGVKTIFLKMSSYVILGGSFLMYLRYSASTMSREEVGIYSSGMRTKNSLKTLLMLCIRTSLISKSRRGL